MSSLVIELETPRVFKPLWQPAQYKGAYGGRGSGKSHNFAEMALFRFITKPGTRIVGIREVQRDLSESVKLLIEDKIRQFKVPGFRALRDRIVTPGDGVMIFRGMQDYTADSIKSLEGFDVAYVEEAHTLTKRSLELLLPTIRTPGSEIWFGWNPRHVSDPVDQFFRGQNPVPEAISVRANYTDNGFFPAELEKLRAYHELHNRERYGHIWLGDYEPMAIGALWDRAILHEQRRSESEGLYLKRIVVAIDPAISAEEGSDEHGIVACALGEDGRGYVLEDWSCRGGPRKWAERAVALFDSLEADAIVIEVNQGGDMVRHTLETVRPHLPIIEVRATRGKHVRAEPIAALYQRGMVSHIGTFPELEDQLCLITAAGYEGEGSPDRADALVWAFSELFPRMTRKAPKAEEIYDMAFEHERDHVTGY